ncbi:hypothetical protein [Paenibacillus polymyxa]|uniref:hypothetical protein n=1 Tax=Paenibacillus polymyxa TaxID=1406 RepID=UPI0018693476|nr:hypothetical protein [Paenibacillus polymyxa]MBE3650830.1 hypothetical protein [Paenibacillus polymyxa]
MVYIEFAKDNSGQRPVLNELERLRKQAAANNPEAIWLLQRITRALQFAQRYGIPEALIHNLISEDDVGIPFTLVQPVKALKSHQPLYELRVNQKNRKGAFRAIFFTHIFEGNQILVFTYSVMKMKTSSPEFDRMVELTERMIPDFLKDPSKYINGG